MNLGIFTPRSLYPLHPRLILFQSYFQAHGLYVELINQTDYRTPDNRINWLTLWFFDLYAIRKCKSHIEKYDIIFITDLRYLPLAKYARKKNKIVIYDTIDHNVYLRFYQLAQKVKAVKLIKPLITSLFKRAEKYYVKYCNEVLVNSDSLFQYFNKKASILYYSSPLEDLEAKNNPANQLALLYLGVFSREKGASEIIDLVNQTNLPLFIFGDIPETGLAQKVKSVSTINHTTKISIPELKVNIQELMKNYFLAGISLIHAPHYSYEVQEANKEIDYLAMGIPLIGNLRGPTKEKIDQGCGIFVHDEKLMQKIKDPAVKQSLSQTCTRYYADRYASNHFTMKLDKVMMKYLSISE